MLAIRKLVIEVLVISVCRGLSWAADPGFWRVTSIEANLAWATNLTGSLAFLPDGQPVASYAIAQSQPDQLAYAEYNGAAWTLSGPTTAATVDRVAMAQHGGAPAWVYTHSDQNASTLYYQDSRGWSPVASQWFFPYLIRLAFDPQTGWPAFLADDTNDRARPFFANLKYYYFDGSQWHSETIDSYSSPAYPGGFGSAAGLVFLPSGVPAVAYGRNETYMTTVFSSVHLCTRQAGGTWSGTTIDSGASAHGAGSSVGGASLAVLPSGEPIVSYARSTAAGVELHLWPPQTTVLATGGGNTRLAVLPDGRFGIAHYAGDLLRYTWGSGSTWQTADVTTGVTGVFGLAISPTTGQPAIAYYDETGRAANCALAFFRGDLNCDGVVDFGDINPFVLALTDPAGYAQAFPACNIVDGDVNADGRVDFGDINPFVALLTR